MGHLIDRVYRATRGRTVLTHGLTELCHTRENPEYVMMSYSTLKAVMNLPQGRDVLGMPGDRTQRWRLCGVPIIIDEQMLGDAIFSVYGVVDHG